MTTVHESPTPLAAEQLPPGRVGLRLAMAAEWTKLWSVRSTMWTLVATGLAVVGLCALSTGTVSPSDIIDDPTRRRGLDLGRLQQRHNLRTAGCISETYQRERRIPSHHG